MLAQDLADTGGSSPHERGTGIITTPPNPIVRFIPARAGNRRKRSCDEQRIAVHPRTSGEQKHALSFGFLESGSSPHERGTGMNQKEVLAMLAVHPRTSGEQRSAKLRSPCSLGSSPHERGTGVHHGHAVNARRFIPARAGNRPRVGKRGASDEVHPRTSGEQRSSEPLAFSMIGSSPHERGTVRSARIEH